MTLQKGDFILIDYVAKVKETNEVFDTTKEDVAKKEHLHKEGQIHEPELVVVGEGWVLKALDDALTTMEICKPCTVEISPEKGFGQRDPEKIKRVPIKQLYAKEINPVVGARIEYQGKISHHPLHWRRKSSARLQCSISRKNPHLRRHSNKKT